MLPRWLHQGSRLFSEARRREVDAFSRRDLGGVHADKVGQALVKRLFPPSGGELVSHAESLHELLQRKPLTRRVNALGRISGMLGAWKRLEIRQH